MRYFMEKGINMEGAVIKKVLNNNVVIAEKDDKDIILIGKGIGFNSSEGKIVPSSRIEKVFIKENEEVINNYNKVLKTIDSEIIGVSEEIIHIAETELGSKLNEPIHVSLPDHINFALTRFEKGLIMENPFLNELKILYPKEYSIASKAIALINRRLNTNLTEDETGFICLHINAAVMQSDVSKSFEYTRKIGDVMELITSLVGKRLNKNSLEYARTLIHVNFMIERIMSGKTIKNPLLENIKEQFSAEFSFAIKVSLKIEGIFSISVPEDEIGYLALHIKRLCDIYC